MSDMSSQGPFTAFINAMRHGSAKQILELGTENTSFLLEIIGLADWAPKIELHCTDVATEAFDEGLVAAADGTNTEFELIKHLGSEVEVNDAILELAVSSPFDAIFISNAQTAEQLLTSLMVAHDSLRSGGVVSLSVDLITNESTALAIPTFRDMFGDTYDEPTDHLFVKL